MDSLTQILLGGSVAAAIAPAGHRRAALLAGAALGTLPDLDSFPLMLLTDDPVAVMTMHRGLSHSLLVLPWVGWLLWWGFRRQGGRVAAAPRRWFWAIQLALLTHPLLDAFTVYGTQLLWPLATPPVMWSSLFIIDPLYTVWLLGAVVAAWWLRARPAAQRALLAGLVISTGYVGWSLAAKSLVDREADAALAALGLADAPRFSVPTPLNTVLWRVVAMTPSGYVEGYHSLWADRGRAMVFSGHPSNTQALRDAGDVPAVQRLAWFNHGFMRARVASDGLELADLRMGGEPDYFFRFLVAERDADGWRAIPPRQLETARDAGGMLGDTWRGITRGVARGDGPTAPRAGALDAAASDAAPGPPAGVD